MSNKNTSIFDSMNLNNDIIQLQREARENGLENSTLGQVLKNSVIENYLNPLGYNYILQYWEENKELPLDEYILTYHGYISNEENTIFVSNPSAVFHLTQDSECFRHDALTDEYIHADDAVVIRDSRHTYYTHIDNATTWNDIYYFESLDTYVTQRYMDYNDIVVMNCGTLEYSSNVFYWESDGEYHYEEEEGQIRSYSYKPEPLFHQNKGEKNPMFMGIELEVENELEETTCKKMSKLVHDQIGDIVYMKTDGSLSNGFEIVSHPMTMEYINTNRERFKKTLEQLSSNGFRSYSSNTCGMHIHMSKESFTTWQLYRFMEFFQKNKEFIVKLSQRDINKLNKWAALSDDNTQDIVFKAKCAKKNQDRFSRYSAINISNRNTVEVRIFRGTLSPGSFFKNIEFCSALYEFTRDTTSTDLPSFKKFIENRQEFKNLAKFIKLKNL